MPETTKGDRPRPSKMTKQELGEAIAGKQN